MNLRMYTKGLVRETNCTSQGNEFILRHPEVG